MPYRIDRINFPRKRDVAAYCGAILRRGTVTPQEDHFLRTLLKGHPLYKRIAGDGPFTIVLATNTFGDPCFAVHRADGKQVEFSFVTCIAPRFLVGAPEAA